MNNKSKPQASSVFGIRGAKVLPFLEKTKQNVIYFISTVKFYFKSSESVFYSSLFTFSPEMPINTGGVRGEEWVPTLHHSSPFFEVFALLGLVVLGLLVRSCTKCEDSLTRKK